MKILTDDLKESRVCLWLLCVCSHWTLSLHHLHSYKALFLHFSFPGVDFSAVVRGPQHFWFTEVGFSQLGLLSCQLGAGIIKSEWISPAGIAGTPLKPNTCTVGKPHWLNTSFIILRHWGRTARLVVGICADWRPLLLLRRLSTVSILLCWELARFADRKYYRAHLLKSQTALFERSQRWDGTARNKAHYLSVLPHGHGEMGTLWY